ncbi:MAG: glycosyltransferase family 39 protein [Deltaproteobacteria bacterium]|nr:glycosyltransferase family 39 protein [Deltaproteobacteria bacterium]
MLHYGHVHEESAPDDKKEKVAFLSCLKHYFIDDNGGRLAAILLFCVSFSLLLVMLPHQGLTDDDDFYGPAGVRYAGWLGDAVTQPSKAFDQKYIDAAFRFNSEHPPFAKYVIGIAHYIGHRALGIFGPLDSARAGVSFFCALMLAFMLRLLWRPFGPFAALFAALATLALPRFLFHSQVATLDVPVAAMVVITVAAIFFAEAPITSDGLPAKSGTVLGEQNSIARRWAFLCGILFGFALLTKLNAPFLAIPATLWAIALRWRGFRFVPSETPGSSPATGDVNGTQPNLRVPAIPRSLLWMLFLGPVVFVAGWPWLWTEGFKRFGGYVAFHMKHYPIYLFYEGEIYDKPFAPWHMPFTMAWAVIPLPLLLLGLVGSAFAVRACWRLLKSADDEGRALSLSVQDKLLSLIGLQAFFAIAAVAFSNVPKYGGEKLFMPFFPLFMILAAYGLHVLVKSVADVFSSSPKSFAFFRADGEEGPSDAGLHQKKRSTRGVILVVSCAFCALLPGVMGSVKTFGGFGLSYYSESIGGLRGATAYGYERTYYDIADLELAHWLDENAGKRSIHFEPNHKEYVRTYRWFKKGKKVRQNLKLSKKKDADLVVLTHERRWKTYPSLVERYATWEVVYEKRIDGVPLYTVFRKP